MILGITGYRPQKCGGFSLPNPTYIHVCQQIEKYFMDLKPEKIITGLALGVDSWAANIAHKLNIPYIAAIPCVGQDNRWIESAKKTYTTLRKLAAQEVIVSSGAYSVSAMHKRNEWIVDHCDTLLAIISPNETSGGTFHCVEYAKSKSHPIIYIDPAFPIQQGKVVNCRTDKCDVFIGRPSKWGNPYSHLPNSAAPFPVDTREEAISLFEEYIRNRPDLMQAAQQELKGKTLGCYCSPLACHGEILLKIANEK